MSAVVVEIGANAAQFEKVVAGLPQRTQAAAGDMTRGFSSAGKSAARSMGQVSMQVQDIAVQLQSGTKAATVLAQQGSQLLSAFGAGGAVAGGALAVGLAFFTMGQKAKEGLEEAKKSAAEFTKELSLSMATGTSSEVMGRVDDIAKRFNAAADNFNKRQESGMSRAMSLIVGKTGLGPSVEELDKQDKEETALLKEQQVAAEARLIELSNQELAIARLKAQGESQKAEEMEHQLQLAREIASINARSISQPVKQQLIANARAQSQLNAPQSPSWFTSMMSGISSAFTRTIPELAKAMSEAMTTQVASLRDSARSLGAAAFSPLKGDADISTGRGSNVNPLTGSASRQISLMLRQASLMEAQAKSLTTSNTLLAAIEKGIARFSPTYN